MPKISREQIDPIFIETIHPSCWYCGHPFTTQDKTAIKFETPISNLRFHEGECWDFLVVGILGFNEFLMDEESKNKATVTQ